jgi:hypothetical protein
VVIERRPAPERFDPGGELGRIEDTENLFACGKMQRRPEIPSCRLGKPFRRSRQPEAGIPIARAIANHQHASRRDPGREPLQQTALLVRGEIMEHIKQSHVPAPLNRI